MKSLLLAAGLFIAAFTTQSFANDVKVTPVVMQTFQRTFDHAANVKWSVVDRLYKAEFDFDGIKSAAFFSIEDGSLVASTRYMTIDELPRLLRNNLKAHTQKATILEMFEVESNDSIDYYVTIKQEGKNVILKSDATKWSVFKK